MSDSPLRKALRFFREHGVPPLPPKAEPAPPPTLKLLMDSYRESGYVPPPIEEFTCYDCPLWQKCEFAFDLYNTDGECLASK